MSSRYIALQADTAWQLEDKINEWAEKGDQLITAYAIYSMNIGARHYAFMKRTPKQEVSNGNV